MWTQSASLAARMVSIFTFLSLLSGAAYCFGAEEAQTPEVGVSPETQRIMLENLGGLSTGFRWSVNPEAFDTPEKRALVHHALQRLAANAADLERHSAELDEESTFLKHSFAQDAGQALRAYEAGHEGEARFVIDQMVDNCIGCHVKLPSKANSEPGKSFIASLDTEGLSLVERVRLEVAARQFDAALATYEAMFEAPSLSPQEIDLSGAFQGYLEVAIQVESNFARPRRVLTKFLERNDLPGYLRSQAKAWVAALDSLARRGSLGEGLQAGRALVEQARMQSVFPEDPRGLVYYVAAASVLHRFLASKPQSVEEKAEAFYLLGVTESHLSHSYWISETEFFLERAIRMAPKAPFAERAYEYLEELTTYGFTGSAGIDIPEDVEQRLKSLHILIYGR